MPSYDDARARATDNPAFSNGTEGEAWMAAWCYRPGAECVRDDELSGNCCPLLGIALAGWTPAEWGERTSALGHGMYECTMYETEEKK